MFAQEPDGSAPALLARFLASLETEVRDLKVLSELRSLPSGDELCSFLHELDALVSLAEVANDEFNKSLDLEFQICRALEVEGQAAAEAQAIQIRELEAVLATSDFFKGGSSLLTMLRMKQPSSAEAAANAAAAEAGSITRGALESIPKSTRQRLTLGYLRGAFSVLIALTNKKSKMLSTPVKRMNFEQQRAFEEYNNLRHPDHENNVFLTEVEIRSTTIFETGDATGKATLQTLRALHKLKMVRSAGENTYVVLI